MKYRTVISLLISTILFSISISPGRAQQSQPQDIDRPDRINLAGGAPWYQEYIDGGEDNSAGSFPSVVFSTGGVPYISYYNSDLGELWYARKVSGGSGNCGDGNHWLCQMVDTDGNVGKFSSIDYWKSDSIIGRWKLGISYYDTTNRALKFAVYSCSLPFTCEWSFNTIQQATTINQNYGLYPSFKFTSDGVPLIAYQYDYTLGVDALKYAYPITSGGNCGLGDALGKWQCDTLDTGEGMGKYASLDLRWDGVLYIAYYDEGGGNLKYTYFAGIGGNCGPADGWLCAVIDGNNGDDVGLYASFISPRFSGDKSRIAYHDKTNGQLKIAYTGAGAGNCDAAGWQCDVVDDTLSGIEPMGISLTTDESGNPIIAYQRFASDLAPATLYIAQSAYELGLNWGNCGDVPPGYLFQYWQCDSIDGASGYVGVANYASVAVDPSGLAIIAYNERLSDFPGYDYLKVAYQALNNLYLPTIVRGP